jgi:sterol desaturase/sphingolipid hydroxylase (fatty acid hydroxylase superfamily)
MPHTLIEISQWWLSGVLHDARRYAVFAVAVWFVLWVALSRLFRPRKIRDESPPARQLAFEFLFSLRSIAIYSTVGIGINLAQRAGVYPLSDAAEHWGWAWFALAWWPMIVAQDGYIYAVHRWMHRPRWFRTFHRRHHKSHNPSPVHGLQLRSGRGVPDGRVRGVWPAMFPTPWG